MLEWQASLLYPARQPSCPMSSEDLILAATVVGIVNRKEIITGEESEEGDIILGLESSGIHSNGLTLARKVLLKSRTRSEILRELLRPTRIYVREVLKIKRSKIEIHGLAHITGGAYSKLKRIGKRAKVGFNLNALPQPHQHLQNHPKERRDL